MLDWYSARELQLPRLSLLALRLFAILCSEVILSIWKITNRNTQAPAERLFSGMNEYMATKRALLGATTLESLALIKGNYMNQHRFEHESNTESDDDE